MHREDAADQAAPRQGLALGLSGGGRRADLANRCGRHEGLRIEDLEAEVAAPVRVLTKQSLRVRRGRA